MLVLLEQYQRKRLRCIFRIRRVRRIMLHIQGGTIHPPDESGGILYPSAPRYKTRFTVLIHVQAAGNFIKKPFMHLFFGKEVNNRPIDMYPEDLNKVKNEAFLIVII